MGGEDRDLPSGVVYYEGLTARTHCKRMKRASRYGAHHLSEGRTPGSLPAAWIPLDLATQMTFHLRESSAGIRVGCVPCVKSGIWMATALSLHQRDLHTRVLIGV